MIAFPALRQLSAANHRELTTAPHCELCGGALAEPHQHVLEVEARGVLCACQACATVFGRGDSLARFRTVPERVLGDPTVKLTAQRWAELGIPVGLVFFVRASRLGRAIAYYPGPAGVTEGDLETDVWEELAGATSLAGQLADDVEALLLSLDRDALRARGFLIPVTTAYDLAGRLQRCWRGFSGGDQARRELATFFSSLEERGALR